MTKTEFDNLELFTPAEHKLTELDMAKMEISRLKEEIEEQEEKNEQLLDIVQNVSALSILIFAIMLMALVKVFIG